MGKAKAASRPKARPRKTEEAVQKAPAAEELEDATVGEKTKERQSSPEPDLSKALGASAKAEAFARRKAEAKALAEAAAKEKAKERADSEEGAAAKASEDEEDAPKKATSLGRSGNEEASTQVERAHKRRRRKTKHSEAEAACNASHAD